MVLVTAITGFDHGSRRRCGDVFEVSPAQAKALKRNGLVTFDEEVADPASAAGEKSSASQAAPVSPQTTVSESVSGATETETETEAETETETETARGKVKAKTAGA